MEKIQRFAADHKWVLLAVLLVFTPAVGFAFGIVGLVLSFVFGIINWYGVLIVTVSATVYGLVRAYRWADRSSGKVEQKLNSNPFDL